MPSPYEPDLKIHLPASEVARRLSPKWEEQCPSQNYWTFTRNRRVLTVYWNGRGVWLTRKGGNKPTST